MQYIAWDRIQNHLRTCDVSVCVRTGFWTRISRKRLEIETWYQWTTNSKWLMGNRLVTWSMTSWDDICDITLTLNRQGITLTLKGQGRDPKMFGDHYLENGWRYNLGCNRTPIGNGIWVSNGHMTDDVTWPWKVKVVTHIYFDANI